MLIVIKIIIIDSTIFYISLIHTCMECHLKLNKRVPIAYFRAGWFSITQKNESFQTVPFVCLPILFIVSVKKVTTLRRLKSKVASFRKWKIGNKYAKNKCTRKKSGVRVDKCPHWLVNEKEKSFAATCCKISRMVKKSIDYTAKCGGFFIRSFYAWTK